MRFQGWALAVLVAFAAGSQPQRPPTPLAPLELTRPSTPGVTWAGWDAPLDRFVAVYLNVHGSTAPRLVDDRQFARRAFLDVWGLLPTRAQLEAFMADPRPEKRAALVDTLLA